MSKKLPTSLLRHVLVPIRAARCWSAHGCASRGAALAYYAVFSLAPILVIAVSISGVLFGQDAVQGRVITQMEGLLGRDGAALVQHLVEASYLSDRKGLAALVGVAGILLGASGLFAEMSSAFQRIFGTRRAYRNALVALVMDRLRGLAVVIGVGFLLVVSLMASAAIVAAGDYLTRGFAVLLRLAGVMQTLLSVGFMTALVVLLYRLLVPVPLSRRTLLAGAATTAVLFEAGKWAIGLYLGRGALATTFGAAGSLAVILVWVYYVALIMLFGAEITRQLYRLQRLRARRRA